jgi:hypothetical protein
MPANSLDMAANRKIPPQLKSSLSLSTFIAQEQGIKYLGYHSCWWWLGVMAFVKIYIYIYMYIYDLTRD